MALTAARYVVTHPRAAYSGAMTFARTANAVKRKASQAMAMYAAAAHYAKKSRPYRARAGTYARKVNRTLFGSRKRRQGQARKALRPPPRAPPRGGGIPPTTTSARVPARYAVANSMTKFKKAKKITSVKVPKTVAVHFKDFGAFNSEKCMYINHEHWGNQDRVWYIIGLSLAKFICAKARIYNDKSLEDAMLGPRTDLVSSGAGHNQTGNSAVATSCRLVFRTIDGEGNMSTTFTDTILEDITASPDVYLKMDQVAESFAGALKSKYFSGDKTWLHQAVVYQGSATNALPTIINNLDDAEVCVYVNSLLKFQNITLADHSQGAGANPYDKQAIDANPLKGRIFSAKGPHPVIDSDLARMGDRTLDTFFGDVTPAVGAQPQTGGITLLGHNNNQTANDLGRISHIPGPKEIYGNQTVVSGPIYMPAGAEKFHKTSYSMKRTFRTLAEICEQDSFNESVGKHTMFGLTLSHRHGEDSIKIGYNRDVSMSAMIKHKQIIHPIKTNFTNDSGVTTCTVVPTNHS